MCRELNCTWRCTNPKHKLTQRRFHIPHNGAPICPICRQPMVPARNITSYRAEREGISKRRAKRNRTTFADIIKQQQEI